VVLFGESQFRRGAYTVVLFICTYFVDEILKNDKKSYVVYCRDDLVPDSALLVIVRGFVVSQDLLIGW